MDPASEPSLLDFCPELLHNIISYTNVPDCAALAKSCTVLRNFLKDNRILWKEMYLKTWDKPPQDPAKPELDWEHESQHLVNCQKLVASQDDELQRESFPDITTAVDHLLQTADTDYGTSRNIALLRELFEDRHVADVLLSSSSLYRIAGSESQKPASSPEARQLSAKLKVLAGSFSDTYATKSAYSTLPVARSIVYDIRRYNRRNLWGPFLDDGSHDVDWEKMEAIMADLAHNTRLFNDKVYNVTEIDWDEPFRGVTPGSYRSVEHAASQDGLGQPRASRMPREIQGPTGDEDPYGITGMWKRIVCFLDYNDFCAFNFTDALPLPHARAPVHKHEAIRLINLQIRVTNLTPPGPNDGQDLPIAHVRGESRSLHTSWDPNANSQIRGTVRMTREGEVRWTTVSIFHGEARWRSEGVQVGGLKSARGVLGTWFEKDYDDHGPCGPTAFWKLNDDYNIDEGRVFPHGNEELELE
ncbi:hypothetical protein K402DRAFT_338324 [Aulographum hederae CBS 113979]|uniref:F-box domain-containing protein n=1 Tax=Aulographum hederae CBS 113979 TaxID=1176131 RepID=A0A6G1GRS9_9PEZI|nr:hypothetical protein K402DRAFT_338324 [Aulographum hederae CBS 113979]